MKQLIICLPLMILMGCHKDPALSPACLPGQLHKGLIAFYPFSEGSLKDRSGNAHDVTNPTSAHPSPDREGNSNCAFEFDNYPTIKDYLVGTSSDFLNHLSSFSISVWYQPLDTARHIGNLEILLSRGDTRRCPDRRGEWSVGLYDCRRAVFAHNNSVWASSVTGTTNCHDQAIAVTDKWQHVVGIYNKNQYSIYFNGNLEESVSGAAGCSHLHFAEDVGEMFIGKEYTGRIDDVLIYNRALTKNEVAALFNARPCCN